MRAGKDIFILLSISILVASCGVMRRSESSARYSKENYISHYSTIAVRQMNMYGIPASIILAQSILESNWGKSELAENANNYFGIKCSSSWKGKRYKHDDDKKKECFRKYKHPEDSFKDHSQFLTTNKRYSALFDLDITDYKAWAKGLKAAGYATNPQYAQLLIDIIDNNSLSQYDRKDKKSNKRSRR